MKIRNLSLVLTGAAATAILGGVGSALVSAASTSPSGGTSRNSIAAYTVREDRLTAEAEVLGTTPTQLENQLKTQTMKQVVAAAALTPSAFRQKVATQLRSDLASQGYSQTQINHALAHKPKNK